MKGGEGRNERAWNLLQAKPRSVIGWRDSAGLVLLLGSRMNQGFGRPPLAVLALTTDKPLVIKKTAKPSKAITSPTSPG